MTPSSCRTAPSLISFQAKRSLTPVMVARLRMRLVAKASSLNLTSSSSRPEPRVARRSGGTSFVDASSKKVPRLRRPSGGFARDDGNGLRRRGQSLLLGEGAVNFIAQQVGQLDAQGLGLAAEEIARARQVDGDD